MMPERRSRKDTKQTHINERRNWQIYYARERMRRMVENANDKGNMAYVRLCTMYFAHHITINC